MGVIGQRRLLGRRDLSLSTSTVFAEGCRLCFAGLKSVVFVTGLCNESCYYCPISSDHLGRDVVKVNEVFVSRVEEAIAEVARSGSRGASITGGEPLMVPRRAIEYVRALKSAFGSRFHVHLYTTGGRLTEEVLRGLERAGLDEIRFHPLGPEYLRKVEMAARLSGMDIGIEVPAVPGTEKWLLELARFLERVGARFMNINELEVSPSNWNRLAARGLRVRRDGVSVEGSYETAVKAMLMALEEGVSVPIHFCPAVYKDRHQTRLRFIVTAKTSAEVYEELTPEGTLLRISLNVGRGEECKRQAKALEIEGLVFRAGERLFAPPSSWDAVVEALGECLGGATIEEVHPTRDRLLVNVTPLRGHRAEPRT